MLSNIVNILIIMVLLLTMVFLIVAIMFLIWYYANEMIKGIKKSRNKETKKVDIGIDTRPIQEQLEEAFGGKKTEIRKEK